eukprot:TRINITY_DN3834_c0_g1_i11.p1 TRINITY_DN3834_c0_g1~~TRINITY_DN3834_c0_g1_i11.p1  ORF type:complete len:206 (-),score=37.96 TRINITY_DN3834_c0_g1_i11:124-741(-)
MLRFSEVQAPFSVFVSQLREFFGLPSLLRRQETLEDKIKIASVNILPSDQGGGEWEVDIVILQRLLKSQEETKETLQRFVNIMGKLERIVIPERISLSLNQVLDVLARVRDHMDRGEYLEALRLGSEGYKKMEIVFFDPHLLSLLYFPEEHKWAVYLPLFLPLFYPLLGNFHSQWKHWRKKRASNDVNKVYHFEIKSIYLNVKRI